MLWFAIFIIGFIVGYSIRPLVTKKEIEIIELDEPVAFKHF